MILIYIAIPVALLIAAAAVAAFIWAARSDQYEDLDTPPWRMLLDDAPISKVGSPTPDDSTASTREIRGTH
ncbi:MAG: cbb3-type cytochrome oxidase assembly protein CcoS [Planctomycetes bacterium]|nr:cbb3-type cytochrome oxidase assembly protein CcoS [Planctomycetota bacterium]